MSERPLRIWLPTVRTGSGADVFVLRLAGALRRAGHQPVLQWFEHRYELMPWRLKLTFAPTDIDVVHAGSWQGFAFHRRGVPLVVTEHQYVSHPAFAPYRSVTQALYHRYFIEFCMRDSYRKADAIVAVSNHVAEAMRKDLKQPVEVIHNWVDCHRFGSAHRAYEKKSAPFQLLFVGNPSPWKGAEILPMLAEMLGQRFEILCVGGLRKQIDGDNLPRNLRLLPRTDPNRMPDLYQSVDAALIPTRYEAFGYVALEAMASRLPIIGFSSTGTAEVAVHGETALLAPVDDLAQLVTYACMLADDSALCERLGKAGRQRALKFFDESKAVEAYLSIYRRVLSTRDK